MLNLYPNLKKNEYSKFKKYVNFKSNFEPESVRF